MGGGGGGFDAGKAKRQTDFPLTWKVYGRAYVLRGGSRIELKKGKDVVLKDGDRLVTEDGYIYDIQDGATSYEQPAEKTWMILYPRGEAVISVHIFENDEDGGKITGHLITRIELVKGLFWVRASTNREVGEKLVLSPNFPQLEFKPESGEFGKRKEAEAIIELSNDSVTVFRMAGRVVHRSLGLEAGGGGNKIVATRNGLYATKLAEYPDKRVKFVNELFRIIMNESRLLKGDGEGGDFSMPDYSPVREEDHVVKREATRTVSGMKEIEEKYWNRMRKIEDEGKERVKQYRETYWNAPEELKKAVQEDGLRRSREEKELHEEFNRKENELIEAGKKGLTAITKTGAINQTMQYREVGFNFSKAERGIEMGMRKSPNGKEFLLVWFSASNTSKNTVFFDPNAEFNLLADGESIQLDNYKLETALDPGKSSDGYLQFIILEKAKNFVVVIGKKIAPKMELKFSV